MTVVLLLFKTLDFNNSTTRFLAVVFGVLFGLISSNAVRSNNSTNVLSVNLWLRSISTNCLTMVLSVDKVYT